MWNKYITLNEARKLSTQFCKDFKIDKCEIFYIDRLSYGTYGEYSWLLPPHILILDTYMNKNPIGIVIHELNHHLQHQLYELYASDDSYPSHGYEWTVAKRKTIKWCKENISDTAPWEHPLRAYINRREMIMFRI